MPTLPLSKTVTFSASPESEITKARPVVVPPPLMLNLEEGLVVPMPTLPLVVAKYAEPVEPIWVVLALPNVWRAVQTLAFAIFKLRADVPPREIGEVPTVMEPLEVRPMVLYCSCPLPMVEEATITPLPLTESNLSVPTPMVVEVPKAVEMIGVRPPVEMIGYVPATEVT